MAPRTVQPWREAHRTESQALNRLLEETTELDLVVPHQLDNVRLAQDSGGSGVLERGASEETVMHCSPLKHVLHSIHDCGVLALDVPEVTSMHHVRYRALEDAIQSNRRVLCLGVKRLALLLELQRLDKRLQHVRHGKAAAELVGAHRHDRHAEHIVNLEQLQGVRRWLAPQERSYRAELAQPRRC
jgi:hypothetical protein